MIKQPGLEVYDENDFRRQNLEMLLIEEEIDC